MNASVHGVSLHTCWTNGLHAVLAWSVTVARATGCLTCFVNNVAGWLPVIVWSCCVSTAKFPIDKMLLNPRMHKILWACVLYSLLSYRAPMCTLSLCWNAMGDYTRRWNRILRHDVGRGAAPKCDELGWVDIESFVLNDFSWPREDDMMIHGGRGARIDESVVGRRRRKLLEGYRHSMSPKAKKKRMLVVALYITPDELEEMWEHEDKDVFTEQVLRQCRGWIRPIALRATSGHSFHAPNKRPLMVNIDYKNLNMPFTKEIAAQVGGGYHVTSVKNLLSIVTQGLMPGGNAGTRDHVFFGEYAPWDPINTCTITWIAGEQEILVLYVPGTRLLKYRSGLTYNGDIVVGETVPFSEVQDAWIAHKSEFGGDVASGSRRIMSKEFPFDSGVGYESGVGQSGCYLMILCYGYQKVTGL